MGKVLEAWDSDQEARIQLRKDEMSGGSGGAETQGGWDNLGCDKELPSGLMGGDERKEASEVVVLPGAEWNGM